MAKRASKSAGKKTRAISLHIGLNGVSAAAYAGWDGPLAACEFDANDMAAIARSKDMDATVLLTKKATRAAVLGAMRSAAKALGDGGFFFVSYSGHGGQVPDVTGEEEDKKDETWCLYDGQLIDDELYFELSRFAAGVRILVLSDSCHSGTVTRAALMPQATIPSQRPKLMPESVAMRTYRDHQKFYDDLQKGVAQAAGHAGSFFRGRPRGRFRGITTPCRNSSPPQTPQGSRRSSAESRHRARTGQSLHSALANSTSWGDSANHRSESLTRHGSSSSSTWSAASWSWLRVISSAAPSLRSRTVMVMLFTSFVT